MIPLETLHTENQSIGAIKEGNDCVLDVGAGCGLLRYFFLLFNLI